MAWSLGSPALRRVVVRGFAVTILAGVIGAAAWLWRSWSPLFGDDVRDIFDVRRSLARRSVQGGTGPEPTRRQLEAAKAVLG